MSKDTKIVWDVKTLKKNRLNLWVTFGLGSEKVVSWQKKKRTSVSRLMLSLWCSGMPYSVLDGVDWSNQCRKAESMASSTWIMLTKRRESVPIQKNKPHATLWDPTIMEQTLHATIYLKSWISNRWTTRISKYMINLVKCVLGSISYWWILGGLTMEFLTLWKAMAYKILLWRAFILVRIHRVWIDMPYLLRRSLVKTRLFTLTSSRMMRTCSQRIAMNNLGVRETQTTGNTSMIDGKKMHLISHE